MFHVVRHDDFGSKEQSDQEVDEHTPLPHLREAVSS